MKKNYIAPELELVKFDAKDIITNSRDPYAEDIFDPIQQ